MHASSRICFHNQNLFYFGCRVLCEMLSGLNFCENIFYVKAYDRKIQVVQAIDRHCQSCLKNSLQSLAGIVLLVGVRRTNGTCRGLIVVLWTLSFTVA